MCSLARYRGRQGRPVQQVQQVRQGRPVQQVEQVRQVQQVQQVQQVRPVPCPRHQTTVRLTFGRIWPGLCCQGESFLPAAWIFPHPLRAVYLLCLRISEEDILDDNDQCERCCRRYSES